MIEGTRRSFASSRSHTEPDPLLLQTGYAGALRKMCSEVKFVRIIETKTLLPEAIWYFGFHCLSEMRALLAYGEETLISHC